MIHYNSSMKCITVFSMVPFNNLQDHFQFFSFSHFFSEQRREPKSNHTTGLASVGEARGWIKGGWRKEGATKVKDNQHDRQFSKETKLFGDFKFIQQ